MRDRHHPRYDNYGQPIEELFPKLDQYDLKILWSVLAALAVIALAVVIWAFLPSNTRAATVSMRAMDAQPGVVVHADGYGNVPKTVASLQALGIQRVRVDSPQPTYVGVGNVWDVLCTAGIKITPFLNGWIDPANDTSPHAEFAATKALEQRHPGCVERIEGPNEVNNFPEHYAGFSDPVGWDMSAKNRMAAQAFQSALYARVKADPVLSSKPVIGYTDVHPVASAADYGNMHVYEGTWCSDPAFQTEAAQMQAAMPGKPMAATEWGYTTVNQVDLATQALRIECSVAAALWNHVNPAFAYELKDEGTSTTDPQQGYGLLANDWSLKPAGQVLTRLMTQINDAGPSTFIPQALSVTVNDPAVYTLLLARSDGSYRLLFWTCAATPKTRNLTFTLDRPMSVGVYRVKDGTSTTWNRASTFTWSYQDGVAGLQVVVLK